MKCDCKTEWKGDYKHSPECAEKRVAWYIENAEPVRDDLSRFKPKAWASAYTDGWQPYIEKSIQMTQDELLIRLDDYGYGGPPLNALRAVVELHKPYPLKPHKPDGVLVCQECTDYSTANWPCATIKAIEKELA